MSQCELHTEPPSDWISECQNHKSLFHSLEWANFLQESFGSESIYLWDDKDKNGTVIQLFRVGFFRIGYIAFPTGEMLGGEPVDEDVIDVVRGQNKYLKIQILRILSSGFSSQPILNYPLIKVPETAIINLPGWCLDSLSSSIKRNINKAMRSGVQVTQVITEDEASLIHNLYSKTIRRHHGVMRYNEKYFRNLLRLSNSQKYLKFFIAKYNNRIISFLVIALHRNIAYYLHGGTDMRYQGYRPSDILFHEAILWAQGNGMQSFNMMSSPPSQQSLVNYKEKWGGITRDHMTYSINIKPTAGAILSIVEKIYRNIVRLRF